MDLSPYLDAFSRNAERIRVLAACSTPEEARWKPSEGQWSLLEVVNHLLDEENEDFRLRIRYLFDRPGETWPPIDPEGWVLERGYLSRDPAASLEAFLDERRRSLEWLATLPETLDWNVAHADPRFKGLRAGDLLASWLAHDYLHLRQIVRIRFARAEALAAPYSTAYAGSW